jgi:hypothetical protein
MRIGLLLRPSPEAPAHATRVELRWTWEWRGWRRLPGAAPAAHAAARAVGLQAEGTIAAAFEAGRHTAAAAYTRAVANAAAIAAPSAAIVAAEEAAASAAAEDPASTTTWPGAGEPQPALPIEDIVQV